MTQNNDEHPAPSAEETAPITAAEEVTEAQSTVEVSATEEAPQQPEPYEMRHVRLHLRYNYNNVEKLVFADKMAEAQKQIGYIEDEKKRANTQFKSRLEMATAERDEMMDRIQTGYEVREVSCTVTANYPEAGVKTVRRSDNGEIVKVEAMTDGERQMSLPGIPSDDAASADAEPVADAEEEADAEAQQMAEDDIDSDAGAVPGLGAAWNPVVAKVMEETAPKPHRKASRMGVVAVPSDGDDFDDPEFNKADY